MRKRQALTGCPKKRSEGSYLIKYYKLNNVKTKNAAPSRTAFSAFFNYLLHVCSAPATFCPLLQVLCASLLPAASKAG